jgi:hypothetical protein
MDDFQVANAIPTSPEYQGRHGESFVFHIFEPNAVYYWRVDQIAADSSIIPGKVWQLTSGGAFYEFHEGFENGLGSWTEAQGTYDTSSSVFHDGVLSLAVNQDRDALTQELGHNLNYRVHVWFYDNAADTSVECMANVVDTSDDWAALGVNTERSTSNYAIRFGGDWSVSSVTRNTGWHKFTWDYRNGVYVKLYIDDVDVATSYRSTYARHLSLGDWWGDGVSGSVYFDDITVETVRHLRADFNGDGIVDGIDLALLISQWMNCGLPECH